MTGALAAGIHYDVDAATYHADPCAEPSLSSSIAKILLETSPRHAWEAHPRLNPAHKSAQSDAFDMGTVAHALVLGRGGDITVVDAADWRTKVAQQARAEAQLDGRTAVLAHQMEKAQAMATAFRRQIALVQDVGDDWDFGAAEVVIAWQEEGLWFRSMIDWLPSERPVIWDYKTTGGSAHPAYVAKTIFNLGYDVSAAFYARGMFHLTGKPDFQFRWVFQETDPPYSISVVEMDPAAWTIAHKKVAAAIDLWKRCMATGIWPAYPARIATAALPPWSEQAWLNREMNDELLKDMGIDPFLALAPWQPPRPVDEMKEPV